MRRFISLIVSVGLLLTSVLPVNAYYTFMPATTVIGQTDFISNSGGATANKLNGSLTRGIFVDPNGRLLISDSNNNRILIWNSIPTTNGSSPNLVLGQADFVSVSANRGGSADASTLNFPTGTYSDGNRLIVADDSNNRVLIWNSFPSRNGQSADIVVGKTSMTDITTTTCNSSTLTDPSAVSVFNGKLLVSESTNNRILIWNSIPTTNGVSADTVIGQADMVTCSLATTSSRTLNQPRQIMVDSNGKLFIADRLNRRILIYNSVPTQNNQPADVAVGQPSFTTSSSSASPSTFFGVVIDLYSSGKRLYISDARGMLIWNSIPTSNGASADLIIGNPNFTTTSPNGGVGSVNARGMASNGCAAVFEANNQLLCADEANARVLIFSNVLSTPAMNINSPTTNADKIRIAGNISLGERPNYSMQKVTASVNGENETNVTYLDGGRDNGPGKTLYEFYNDFIPTNRGGDQNNYTVAFRAQSFNAEEDKRFYFTPFSFDKITIENLPTISFTVNKTFRDQLRNNLSKYQIWIKKDKEKNFKLYVDNIDVNSEYNGNITLKSKTRLLPGTYQFQVRAINTMGREQQSNNLNIKIKK